MKDYYLTLYQTPEGSYQLTLDDDSGGYRVFGGKFIGTSIEMFKHKLNSRDVNEFKHAFEAMEEE